jgi:hypothetical protein
VLARRVHGMLESLSIADSGVRTGILTVLSGCLCGCSVGSRLDRYRGTPAAKFDVEVRLESGMVSACQDRVNVTCQGQMISLLGIRYSRVFVLSNDNTF